MNLHTGKILDKCGTQKEPNWLTIKTKDFPISRQDITIRITAQEEAGYHLISIRDNGIGIPAKENE